MTFKFLRFPVLVQRAVLQNMDIFEVLVLLMMSKTVKRTLNAYKYRIDNWDWTNTDYITMSFRGKSVHIKLSQDGREVEPGMFSLEINQEKLVVRIVKPEIDELDSKEELEEEPEEESEEELEEESEEELEEDSEEELEEEPEEELEEELEEESEEELEEESEEELEEESEQELEEESEEELEEELEEESEQESEEEPEEEPEKEVEEEPKEKPKKEPDTVFLVEHATENDKSERSKLKLNELISCHLLSFIRPASFNFYWDTTEVSPDNLFIFELTNKFNFEGIAAFVSAETIKMLMEEITTEQMHLSIQCTTENFKYQNKSNEVSKIEHLYILESDFVQFENFIKYLNSPRLRCYVPSTKAMNSILKEWIGGENNVLEFLKLFDFGNLNKRQILEGIDYTVTRFKRKELISRFGSESAFRSYRKYSFDVKRTSDDRVATLVILKEELRIYVWTDEHLTKIRNIL